MRITFIVPTLNLSGGLRVVSIYANLLADKGHHVTVVSPNQKKPTLKEKAKSLLKWKDYVFESNFNQEFFKSNKFELKILERYRPVLSSDLPDADVVIATFWNTAEWLKEVHSEKGKKVYLVQHDETHNRALPIERVISTYNLDFDYITIANWLVDLLKNQHKAEHVYLIPNSVDTNLFYADKRNKQFIPTIGFLYSETHSKGLHVTIDVVAKLKKEFPELRVLSFGAKKSTDKSLPEYIELTLRPQQSQIREIYSQCDVWLCCSTTEGFGLPVLEAMACRTPVVSTRCGGPEDIVVDRYNGYLCDVNDVDSLTVAVRAIINLSNEDWQYLSYSSYERATRYTWDDAATLFEQTLKKSLRHRLNCL